MSLFALINGRIVSDDQVLEGHMLLIEDGYIMDIRPGVAVPAHAQVIDVHGLLVAPGLIDVHVHGGNGCDTMDATPQSLAGLATFIAAHGVTSFLPTTMAADQHKLLAAVKNIGYCQQYEQGGARILGIHLEGPYLNAAHPGAQPIEYIHPAIASEYEQLFAAGNISLISLAPEIAANLELVWYAVACGTRVAVGHSAATYQEVMTAVECGLTQACHTFNGMTGLHHRDPGTVGAVLNCDEIYAQVIADLIHVHPAVLKILFRAKGIERTILITDAMRAAGLPDGQYELGGQVVTLEQGAVHLTHGVSHSLAGSVLTMDQAVRNMMKAADLSFLDVLPMATRVPAQALGLGHVIGRLAPGYIADLILLDQDIHVQATLVRGKVVYQAAGSCV
jgi:N-acetylglucosamine-6-phosphate deacetylase